MTCPAHIALQARVDQQVARWRDQVSSTPTLDGVASHARCVEDAEPAGLPGAGRFGNPSEKAA